MLIVLNHSIYILKSLLFILLELYSFDQFIKYCNDVLPLDISFINAIVNISNIISSFDFTDTFCVKSIENIKSRYCNLVNEKNIFTYTCPLAVNYAETSNFNRRKDAEILRLIQVNNQIAIEKKECEVDFKHCKNGNYLQLGVSGLATVATVVTSFVCYPSNPN